MAGVRCHLLYFHFSSSSAVSMFGTSQSLQSVSNAACCSVMGWFLCQPSPDQVGMGWTTAAGGAVRWTGRAVVVCYSIPLCSPPRLPTVYALMSYAISGHRLQPSHQHCGTISIRTVLSRVWSVKADYTIISKQSHTKAKSSTRHGRKNCDLRVASFRLTSYCSLACFPLPHSSRLNFNSNSIIRLDLRLLSYSTFNSEQTHSALLV